MRSMKRNRKMKKYKKKNPSRYSMILVFFVVLMLGGLCIHETNSLKDKKEEYIIREASLARQMDAEKENQTKLLEREKYVNSDEYIQEEAREKIGLVKENEVIFKEE